MAQRQHIEHSIPPTFDARSRVLVLGTMPSPASRDTGFNYGHPRNRFWPVMAQLAGEPPLPTNDAKRDFCLRHHIALWDVLAECDIEGASDASIANAVPNKLTDITHAAPIEAVFCTGAKSFELYNRYCADEVGIPAVKLPSTSPANAACKFDQLLSAYAAIFEHEHPFEPPVLDVENVVKLEQAIAAAGTPLSELMDRAGRALAWRVKSTIDGTANGQAVPVVVLCGNGNNGGDGWVAAELLALWDIPVVVLTAKTPDQITAQPAHDAALRALETLAGRNAAVVSLADLPTSTTTPLVAIDDGTDFASRDAALARLVSEASVIVDAILGTGATGKAPRAPFDAWINALGNRAANAAIIAADMPSGVGANDGIASAIHVNADETVTMIVPKPGITAPECGRATVAPLAYIEPFLP